MDWTPFLTPALGTAGLVALAVILIFRGLLVPRSTMDARIADKDAQIEMWKTSCERYERAVQQKDRQIMILLEGTKTTTHVVAALSEAAGLEGSRHALAPPEE